MSRLRRRGVTAVAVLAGLVLFAVTIRAVDTTAVLEGVRQVGVGFVWLFLLAGIRLAARAGAWVACAGRDGNRRRLPFADAFSACVVAEAAGNLTPAGLAASEPAKVVSVRSRLGTLEAAASLAAETVFYSIGTAALLVVGTLVWIRAVAPAAALPVTLVVCAAAVSLCIVPRLRRRGRHRVVSSITMRLEAWSHERRRLQAVVDGVSRSVEILRDVITRRPAALVMAAVCQAVFQVAAVAEVWLTLVLLGVPHITLTQALLLEYANRVTTIVFTVIPLRVGVDELASGAMASVLGGSGTVGVTVAVVRKARVLCWSGIGALTLAARSAGLRSCRSVVRRRLSAPRATTRGGRRQLGVTL